ncbi:MAG: response regulator [Archangium sp.]|nr:response regulator [Archangium sp.]
MPTAQALLTLSRALHGVETLEGLMEQVQQALLANTRYRSTYLHLLPPDGKTFEIIGFTPHSPVLVKQRGIDFSRDELLQLAITATEPFVLPDLRLEPRADQKQVEFFGNRTSIVVPMFDGDARLGPLVVASYAAEGVLLPTEAEYEFILHTASLVAVVIGRLRAETARREAETRAASTERMQSLGRMAGEVSHDFNNLLVAILTNVGLAIDELGPHPTVELLEDVRSAANRASRLTRQLLAFSRGQVLNRVDVDVPALFASVTKLVAPLLPAHVTLTTSVAPAMAPLAADVDQLERALTNLIVNARDAIGAKRGRITLEAEVMTVADESIAGQHELKRGTWVMLAVSDDGAGMDAATRARVFEPFFTTKPAERGTGLGLAVVDGVVRQHGGSVHLYSEVGKGTTLKLFLPAEVSHRPSPPTHAPPPRRHSERVLVVDDDEQVRRSVERVLLRAGFVVRVVGSAEAALDALEHEPFELLLTDIMLPGLDGVQLAERGRARRPTMRVCFMTGYARGRDALGGAPHLTKPFTASDLLARINHALDAST